MKKFLSDTDNLRIVIGLAFAAIVLAIAMISNRVEWNGGVCRECKGQLEFRTAVSHGDKGGTSYIYQCDRCGRLVEVTEMF